ncbi:MAG: class I SAM-dependent methyltransferase [Burkholderiaceae bacterium]
MNGLRRQLLILSAALAAGTGARAQGAAGGAPAALPAPGGPRNEYRPRLGQMGKDVMWLPTPEPMIRRMMLMANVSARDKVVDLGSGDGRIAIAAARDFGARAHGIEFNPDMVELSRRRSAEAGLAERATFERGDVFVVDFSDATVVTTYLLPILNLRLRPTLMRMKPGTRIVSYTFDMGSWEPDEISRLGNYRSFLWRIPAAAAGSWTLTAAGAAEPFPAALTIDQRFQMISGELQFGELGVSLIAPRLQGDQIEFSAMGPGRELLRGSARIDGERMAGRLVYPSGASVAWQGRRTTPAHEFPEAAYTPQEEINAARALGE